jgi:hypothetical protein
MAFRVPLLVTAFCAIGLVGCNSGKLDDEEDGSSSGTTDGGDGSIDLDEVQFDGDRPVVVEGEVWCQAGSDSSGMVFIFDVKYADPQGDYDVAMGEVTGSQVSSGTEIFTDSILVCRDGQCDGSFRDGHYPPITCSTASDYAFSAWVTDRAGLVSDVVELTWVD